MFAALRVGSTLLLLAGAAACADQPPDPDPDPDPIEDADDLFSLDQVAEVRLELSTLDYARLAGNPREYVRADLRLADTRYEGIGVRLKGTYSFEGLDGKAAFKLDFDQFQAGRTILGLEGLTLNNLRQDHSALHEMLSYLAFREAGAVAPRAAFAAVWVNGDYYGLYAMVESVDDAFLAERFADPSGNLYEGDFGDDLRPEDLWEYDQDEGLDESRADLDAFIAQAQLPDDTVFFGPGALLDLDPFLTFVAAESITGHWDGYVRSHNYRIYHEPTVDKWYFIPWGTDMAFDRDVDAFASQGLLARKCFDSPACRVEYARVAQQAATRFMELELEQVIDEAVALTHDYLVIDGRKPFSLEAIQRHQAVLRQVVTDAPGILLEAVDCVDQGAEADRDLDGWGDCLDDCEPASGDAHPGGIEICDGLDNDCNGRVDEIGCSCPTLQVEDDTFHFCDRAETWSRAVSECTRLGGRLAWFDDEEQNRAVWAHSQGVRAGRWTIGLNDRGEEGVYAWQGSDGEPAELSIWAAGEPEDFGGQDCGAYGILGDAGWEDVQCNFTYPFICRSDT